MFKIVLKGCVLGALVFLAGFSFCQLVRADGDLEVAGKEEGKSVDKDDVLVPAVVILGNHSGRPKYYMEDGKSKGFIVDITTWCLDDMKVGYEVKLCPWARAYQNAIDGEGYAIGLSMSEERLKIFDFSDPMYEDDIMVVVKKGKEFQFSTVKDLQGKVIGLPRGGSYGDEFDRAVKEGVIKILDVDNHLQALRMLAIDRLDAVLLGPGKYGVKMLVGEDKSLKEEDYAILPHPFKRDIKYLGVAKKLGKREFLDRFNASLKVCRDTGKSAEIIETYLIKK